VSPPALGAVSVVRMVKSQMADLISVVVSTYNREDALDAVLRSLSRQTDRQFEVVVADDGSDAATTRVVESWSHLPVPLKHVRHEHHGFRLAEIRNRAILVSAGSYCIFLDGDCLVRPNFVAAHRRLAEPGCFVTGNRVQLSQNLSRLILDERLEAETWPSGHWAGHRARGDVNRFLPLLLLPLGPLRKRVGRRWRGAQGCNMAFFRSDIERVDGFDAAFTGWGREDSDMFVRLIRHGVLRKDGRHATTVLHLWHPESDRSKLPGNQEKLDLLLRNERVRASQGLSTLVTAPGSPQIPDSKLLTLVPEPMCGSQATMNRRGSR
jgi:glycosyltransferase involved in cell wall biosynthesis